MILWVLLMDVDSPNLKPRPALENAAACLVYISHTINILTTLLATVALLQVFVLGGLMIFAWSKPNFQEEYPVVLCWALWAIVMAVVQLVLCFVSSFTVLRCQQFWRKMFDYESMQCEWVQNDRNNTLTSCWELPSIRYVPARLCLHITSCLLALWAAFVMVQVNFPSKFQIESQIYDHGTGT